MTHASTFSGIGGAEVAADMMGWENLFHCEINPFGRKILDYHYPNSKSYEDITKTDFSEWRGRVDVLTGGFPCQPFSYAGKRRGAEDDRYLWPYMLRCIEQVRPSWFVGENVAGITTMALPSETAQVAIEADLFGEGYTYEKTSERFVLDEICGNLERIGYAVQPFIIPACSVGAPHRRDRIFIVACDTTYNTKSRADFCGVSRTNASESGTERLQERHEIPEFGEPTPLRSTMRGTSSDTRHNGMEGRHKSGSEEEENGGRPNRFVHVPASADGGGWSATDTTDMQRHGCESNECGGLQEIPELGDCGSTRIATDTSLGLRDDLGLGEGDNVQPKIPQLGAGDREDGNGGRIAPDTESQPSGRPSAHGRNGAEGQEQLGGGGGQDSLQRVNLFDRWRAFPTVSPILRGDDGLPFDVDGLAISASKWRTESLKAYGNAIVPQVMYEIFRAIEYADTCD